MIGDCQFDGSIFSLRLMHRKKGIASAFCSSISKSLETPILDLPIDFCPPTISDLI